MGESDTLGRLFDKVDKINERTARLETMMLERNKREDTQDEINKNHEARLKILEEQKAAAWGIKGFVIWLITAGIALYGVTK